MSFFLGLYRNKKFIGASAALFVIFLATAGVSEASSFGVHGIVYKTSMGLDLDGDHIPETVTIRQSDSFYQVSIHFSTGRPKLRLRTYVAGDIAGLTFEIADINNDSEADLVITSATSISPVATWLNRGAANFQKVSVRTHSVWSRYVGSRLKRKTTERRDPVGSLSRDRLPQAEGADSFIPCTGSENLLSSVIHSLPADFWLAEVPSRGPPSAPHI